MSAAGDAALWVEALAEDLKAHRGRSVVVAGERQPAAVHQLSQAAEVFDDVIRHGADTDGVANATLYRHSRKRRKRLHVLRPTTPLRPSGVPRHSGALQ